MNSIAASPLKAKVALEFGALKGVMAWCKDNCVGEWGLDYAGHLDTEQQRFDTYEFVFRDEGDLVAFALRWR